MRCAVCSGPLIYDRIDKESRCLMCGRPEKREAPARAETATRMRMEYPRRYRISATDDQAACWG
jgi:hypothetical protein